jgi:hypothetical protein
MSVTTETTQAEPSLILRAEGQVSHQGTNVAFVFGPTRRFTFEKRSIPELRSSRDVRVRIVATGLCGSDVSDLFPFNTYHTDLTIHVDPLLATWTYRSICRTRPDSPWPRVCRHRRSVW